MAFSDNEKWNWKIQCLLPQNIAKNPELILEECKYFVKEKND